MLKKEKPPIKAVLLLGEEGGAEVPLLPPSAQQPVNTCKIKECLLSKEGYGKSLLHKNIFSRFINN